ncbi:MAG: carboxymuconolactone decarboxylase family protein [Pseudomonadota bacterium]
MLDTSLTIPGVDRFPPRDKASLNASQQALFADIEARRGKMPAPYEALAGSPEVATLFERLSTRLWKGALPAHVLEVVFLITARHHRCAYQWQTHRSKALEAGVETEVIRAIGSDSGLDGISMRHRELADLYTFLRALYGGHAVSDHEFKMLATHFDETELSELLAFCGLATSVAMLLNVRQIMPAPSADDIFS